MIILKYGTVMMHMHVHAHSLWIETTYICLDLMKLHYGFGPMVNYVKSPGKLFWSSVISRSVSFHVKLICKYVNSCYLHRFQRFMKRYITLVHMGRCVRERAEWKAFKYAIHNIHNGTKHFNYKEAICKSHK